MIMQYLCSYFHWGQWVIHPVMEWSWTRNQAGAGEPMVRSGGVPRTLIRTPNTANATCIAAVIVQESLWKRKPSPSHSHLHRLWHPCLPLWVPGMVVALEAFRASLCTLSQVEIIPRLHEWSLMPLYYTWTVPLLGSMIKSSGFSSLYSLWILMLFHLTITWNAGMPNSKHSQLVTNYITLYSSSPLRFKDVTLCLFATTSSFSMLFLVMILLLGFSNC